MKQIFHKIFSILMAFVVLLSTMSFTVDMHFCGDSLIDISVISKAESCGMDKAQPNNSCENPVMTEKKCCSDHQIVKEANDELTTSFAKLSIEQQTFVALFFYSYKSLFEELDEHIIPFKDYSPPFAERDFQILYQTYLI